MVCVGVHQHVLYLVRGAVAGFENGTAVLDGWVGEWVWDTVVQSGLGR